MVNRANSQNKKRKTDKVRSYLLDQKVFENVGGGGGEVIRLYPPPHAGINGAAQEGEFDLHR